MLAMGPKLLFNFSVSGQGQASGSLMNVLCVRATLTVQAGAVLLHVCPNKHKTQIYGFCTISNKLRPQPSLAPDVWLYWPDGAQTTQNMQGLGRR